MNGIPGDLMRPLKETLRRCDVFDSDRALQNVFTDQRLYRWRDDLHEADNKPQRVENLIYDLVEQYRRTENESENALQIFLLVLAERYKQDDDRSERLHALADTLKWCLERPAPLPTNHTTPQANPQAKQMLLTDNLEKMLACTRSVAHIKLQLYRNKTKAATEPWTGTGWLIAPEIVATCWHMVTGRTPSQEPPVEDVDLQLQIQNMLFTFDYLSAGRSITYKIAELLFPLYDDPNSITDYAILRLKDREDFPLSTYRPLQLELDVQLTSQSLLYIIQHPLGDRQHIAYDTYEQESSWPGRIHYHTPTEKGTSGAPILNPLNWHVIGLHNGEDQEANLREGTLIKYILNDLHDNKPEVWTEITSYHHIQISTNPIVQTPKYAQTQTPVVSSTQEPPFSSAVDTSPADSPALIDDSIDKFSTADQSDPLPKGNLKHHPFHVLKRYQDEFVAELKTLRSERKLFARPKWPYWGRQTVYPDECKHILEELVALERSMRKYDTFFEQRERLPRSQRQILLGKLHRFQGQIGELHSILTNFCAGNQAASSELQNTIYRQIKCIVDSGNKIKSDFTDILHTLEKLPFKENTQSTEGQVS